MTAPPGQFRKRITALAADAEPGLLALYRELHARPELSGQEKETAARMAAELRAPGLPSTPGSA
ncbi:MAG TPA: hypothetical protein VK450_02500, partial [Methanomicrobiales archaeon]|nr:hypothetical protein [Methanomicrobiales archaeon]